MERGARTEYDRRLGGVVFKRLMNLFTAKPAPRSQAPDAFGTLLDQLTEYERGLFVIVATHAWRFVGIGVGDALDYALKIVLLLRAASPHPEWLAEARRAVH